MDPGTRATGEEIRTSVHGKDIADVSGSVLVQEAMSRDGKALTATKWVGWNEKEMMMGNEFVDMSAGGTRRQAMTRRAKGRLVRGDATTRWKLMFVDEKMAYLNARCDEEEWVELLHVFEEHGRYLQH